MTASGPPLRDGSPVPERATAWWVAGSSVLVIAATYRLALRPGAAQAQTALVTWLNDPPQPLAAVLAVSNALFRPVPLAVVAVLLLGWIMVTARGGRRREVGGPWWSAPGRRAGHPGARRA